MNLNGSPVSTLYVWPLQKLSITYPRSILENSKEVRMSKRNFLNDCTFMKLYWNISGRVQKYKLIKKTSTGDIHVSTDIFWICSVHCTVEPRYNKEPLHDWQNMCTLTRLHYIILGSFSITLLLLNHKF